MEKLIYSEIRVRFSECDYYKHVNNGSYITYLDVGITDFFNAIKKEGGGLIGQDNHPYLFHLVHATVDYKAGATFDDILVICTYLEKTGNSSITFYQTIKHKDTDELVVSARRVGVFLDSETSSKVTVPDEIRKMVYS